MDSNRRPNEMFCPLVNREIDSEMCYETVMAVDGLFKLSSVPEMNLNDREAVKRICDRCPYSDIE